MRGKRKSCTGGFDRIERGLHQRPFPPSTFDPPFGEGDIFVVGKRLANMLILFYPSICIKMDCHVIPDSRQLLCLINNGLRIFMAQ